MKAGSLVVCIDNSKCTTQRQPPSLTTIYTVRQIIAAGEVFTHYKGHPVTMYTAAIYLEEIVNGLVNVQGVMIEPPYAIEWFREVQPPMNISIEELLSEPELV